MSPDSKEARLEQIPGQTTQHIAGKPVPHSSRFSFLCQDPVDGDSGRDNSKLERGSCVHAAGQLFSPPPPTPAQKSSSYTYYQLPMQPLTIDDMERAVHMASPWKAPGHDDLPAVVWQQLWPVVKEVVVALFQDSL